MYHISRVNGELENECLKQILPFGTSNYQLGFWTNDKTETFHSCWNKSKFFTSLNNYKIFLQLGIMGARISSDGFSRENPGLNLCPLFCLFDTLIETSEILILACWKLTPFNKIWVLNRSRNLSQPRSHTSAFLDQAASSKSLQYK